MQKRKANLKGTALLVAAIVIGAVSSVGIAKGITSQIQAKVTDADCSDQAKLASIVIGSAQIVSSVNSQLTRTGQISVIIEGPRMSGTIGTEISRIIDVEADVTSSVSTPIMRNKGISIARIIAV